MTGGQPMTGDNAAQTRARLRDALAARSRAGVAGGCDVRVALAIGDLAPLVCSVSDAGVHFDDSLEAEATFRFDCAETALALLGGDGDLFTAFMAGKFRADGHLTLTFPLMAAFGGAAMAAPP